MDCKQHSLFSSCRRFKKTLLSLFKKNIPEFPLHTLYEDLLNNNYSFDKASEKLYLYSGIILKRLFIFLLSFRVPSLFYPIIYFRHAQYCKNFTSTKIIGCKNLLIQFQVETWASSIPLFILMFILTKLRPWRCGDTNSCANYMQK